MLRNENKLIPRKENKLSDQELKTKLLQKELTLDAVMMELKHERDNTPKTPILNYLGECINNKGYEYYFQDHIRIDPKVKDREVVVKSLGVYIVGSVLGDYSKNDDILVWYEGMAQDLIATSL